MLYFYLLLSQLLKEEGWESLPDGSFLGPTKPSAFMPHVVHNPLFSPPSPPLRSPLPL